MLGILRKFGTGYLSTNLDRMSGTIQYANTFGVIISVISIVLIKKIDSFSKKNIIKYSLLSVILFLFISSIMLTSSRYLMLVYLVFLVVLIFKHIENKAIISSSIISSILLSFLMSTLILNNIGNNKIYLIYVLFLIITIFINIGIYLLFKKVIKNRINKKVVIIVSISLLAFVSIYILLNACLFKSVELNANNTSYEAYIYSKNQNKYDIKFDFNESNDFSLDVRIYEVLKNDMSSIIKSYNYTEINKEDIISINDYKFNENFKCLKIDLVLKKGNVSINKLNVNSKDIAISYYLIPYTFITRFLDSINGSNSTSLRYTYMKDALKISKLSIKNFFFGCGGEAFKNMYNSVKEINYISTEVHSSFIQIFIECGIFALVSIITLIIYIICKGKNSEIKVALILLVVHSLFDLNFSYMITLALFSIIIALIEYKEIENKKDVKYFSIILYVIIILSSLVVSIVSLFAYASSKMSINTENELDINVLNKKIDFAYKKYYLDKTEYESIKNIVLLKENHISLLKEDFKDENVELIKQDIIDINNFLVEIRENNKYNKEAIYFVCEKYYESIENFAYVFYDNDIKSATNEYKKTIYELLEDLRIKYKIHESTNKKIDYLEKIYK